MNGIMGMNNSFIGNGTENGNDILGMGRNVNVNVPENSRFRCRGLPDH